MIVLLLIGNLLNPSLFRRAATIVRNWCDINDFRYLNSCQTEEDSSSTLWDKQRFREFTSVHSTLFHLIDDGTVPEPDQESFEQIHVSMMPPGVVSRCPESLQLCYSVANGSLSG